MPSTVTPVPVMRLVSVNVGQPRPVPRDGGSITTGIFKTPVAGPVRVGPLNLEGDGQADPEHHGGEDMAVYAFSLEQYAHWARELGRASLPHAAFGENLTIAGLDETELCVGDHLRIGTTLLAITQPRVPCFKLGLRLGAPDLPPRFSAHAYTGCYLRVLETGRLAADDEVVRVARGPGRVNVRALFRAYFDPSADGAAAILQRALEVPELSADWRRKVCRRLDS
jgi:MOSC domain-containing protein YiiM